MKQWISLAVAVVSVPVLLSAQQPGYPQTIVPPGKGPFTFPAGYVTPWEKVEILVKEKLSPNLFVLHGSEGVDTAHPDGSGAGRWRCSALTAC